MDTRASDRIAKEQFALRRVAVLMARGVPSEEVFAAVAAEAGRLLRADVTAVGRYDPGGTITFVARWGAIDDERAGARHKRVGGRNVSTLVFETGRPARMDDISLASGATGDVARRLGIRSNAGAPISVQGRLWGVLAIASTREEPLPADTEARLAGFTELVGTAIANAQARMELRGYADEQAALRRVATLVARAARPQEVFATVAEEIGRLLAAGFTSVVRYDQDGMATSVGLWSRTGTPSTSLVGNRRSLGGRNVATLVFQTGQPVRIDDYTSASGAFGDAAQSWGFRVAVGVPISVAGRLWGAVVVGYARLTSLPAGTEARLAGFTELVGTAIANAEAQDALAASRARIVAVGDEARRRIERDLHDGAQQRLVTLALHVRAAQAKVPAQLDQLTADLDHIAADLSSTLDELRAIACGIHPAELTQGGLRPALKALARRCAIPVNLSVEVADRLPDLIEIAAYYLVSEALTNITKHAGASVAEVEVVSCDGVLRVCVRDAGRGGADFGHGSGLVGLKDRVEALGGTIALSSPPGEGTALEARVPLAGPPAHGVQP
jgi:signal transduction histidine kinase